MKKLLLIVDEQEDFITGSLPAVHGVTATIYTANFIKHWDGDIIATQDTHSEETYLKSNEGKHLPVLHTIYETPGWKICSPVREVLEATKNKVTYWNKETFGDYALGQYIQDCKYDYVVIVGVCTDICVISNALILKAYLPEAEIKVIKHCCAGSTPEAHDAALLVMRHCQIEVI